MTEAPALEADGPQLREALAAIKRLGKRSVSSEALIDFADGEVIFTLPGMTISANATGAWPGQARVSVGGLHVLATVPAKTATLRLTVRKDRLYLEGASVPCVWQIKNRPIPLPMNATVAHLARLVYHHTYEEIQSAGLEDAVEKAIDQREQAILVATRALKPFGITEDEIRALVDAKLEVLPEP